MLKRGLGSRWGAVKTISSPSKMHFLPLLLTRPQFCETHPAWGGARKLRCRRDTGPQSALSHAKGRTSSTDRQKPPSSLAAANNALTHWTRTTLAHAAPRHNTAFCPERATLSYSSAKSPHEKAGCANASLKPSFPAHAPPSLCSYCSLPVCCHHWYCCCLI